LGLLKSLTLACVVTLAGTAVCLPAHQATAAQSRPADVVYIPTAPDVVAAMLSMARITSSDVVYDLGSGDGRIVIAAVKDYGAARGTGVEIDPVRVVEANANARQAGVSDRVQFVQGDVLETDVSQATVVTLFMSPAINLKLRPKLMAQLKPGSRVVSHAFDMGDWKPTDARTIRGRMVYLWTIPPRR
jgi:precorrin-6B methylase 2